jgi:hypothetical protein
MSPPRLPLAVSLAVTTCSVDSSLARADSTAARAPNFAGYLAFSAVWGDVRPGGWSSVTLNDDGSVTVNTAVIPVQEHPPDHIPGSYTTYLDLITVGRTTSLRHSTAEGPPQAVEPIDGFSAACEWIDRDTGLWFECVLKDVDYYYAYDSIVSYRLACGPWRSDGLRCDWGGIQVTGPDEPPLFPPDDAPPFRSYLDHYTALDEMTPPRPAKALELYLLGGQGQ